MTKVIQANFAGGEVSPQIAARPDLDKYRTSLARCENFVTLAQGGAVSRPGLEYVYEVKDSTKTTIIHHFEFNTTQTYCIEFGENYIRFHTDGGTVLDSSFTKTITGATQANPCVVTTSASHGLSAGDEIYISGVVGMTELNGRQLKVTSAPSGTTIELEDMAGNAVDSTNYTAYSSGGEVDIPYEVTTTYAEADLTTLRFVQSADVLTITHPSYPPADLTRTANDNWTLTDISFVPDQDLPTNLSVTVNSTGSVTDRYVVTAVSFETEEESLRATATGVSISAATQADPCVVTATGHGLSDGDQIYIDGVVGMTELNGRNYEVIAATANTLELYDPGSGTDIDSSNYTAYSSGGTVYPIFFEVTNSANTRDNTVSWTAAAGAEYYNVYRRSNGVYGFIGRTALTSFEDDNIDPDTTDTPPLPRTPFIGSGNYPSVAGYFKQRKVFANTDNKTQTVWLTQTGNFYNLSRSSPAADDDAIIATIASQEANEILGVVPLRELIILTSGAEWSITGPDGVIAPSTIETDPQSYYGSVDIEPLTTGNTVLFLQPGQTVRDLGYEFTVDAYAGNDVSILARHLLNDNTIVDWTYAVAPYNVVWAARDDGMLLGLTYMREQNVFAWHRHTTRGKIESVAAVRESNDDRLYTITQRRVGSRDVRFIERMNSRRWKADIQNTVALDTSVFQDNPIAISGFTQADPVVVTTATAHGFSNGDTVDIEGIYVRDTSVTPGIALDTDINGTGYTVANVTSNTFELQNNAADVDGTGFGEYAEGGNVRLATTTVGGLWHLEGETVTALCNGAVERSLTVTDGQVTLSESCSRVCVGWEYTCDLETLRLDDPNQSIAGRDKKISRMTLDVENTRGMWVGPDRDNMREQKFDQPALLGQPPDLVTGYINTTMKPDWNKEGSYVVQQRDPLPMTVLSLIPDVIVGGN